MFRQGIVYMQNKERSKAMLLQAFSKKHNTTKYMHLFRLFYLKFIELKKLKYTHTSIYIFDVIVNFITIFS